MKNRYFVVPFFNFFIAALLGLLLRGAYVFPDFSFNFLFLLHAHSHVAMLGWVYLMIYLLYVRFYAPPNLQDQLFYKRLFWVTQLSVLGMLLSFPFQGYAAISIGFSTLHIFCSYVFAFRLWKANTAQKGMERFSLKTSLAFMVLATLGVWCLGPAVGLMGKSSAFYQIAIQFFLHFQFNGWFLFAVLTLVLSKWFQLASGFRLRFFYFCLVSSVFLTFALPLKWYLNLDWLHYVNACGVLLQTIAFLVLFDKSNYKLLFETTKRSLTFKIVYWFSFLSLVLRLVLLLFTCCMEIAEKSHVIRSWTVGFIHLNMLGVITGFILLVLLIQGFLNLSKSANAGIVIFVISYFLTEVILFGEGIFVLFQRTALFPLYPILFWISIGLPIGIMGMMLSFLSNQKYSTPV